MERMMQGESYWSSGQADRTGQLLGAVEQRSELFYIKAIRVI